MTVVLVLYQPLRISQALSYASALDASTDKIVLTSEAAYVDEASLPANTTLAVAADDATPTPSTRATASRLVVRARRWARSGSSFGLRVSRWLHSAAWRLRYLDRLKALLDHRRSGDWDVHVERMLKSLRTIEETHGVDQIVVFDVFDLPAVLEFANQRAVSVLVR